MNIRDFNIGIEIEYAYTGTRRIAHAIQQRNLDCELVPYGRCHANHSGWIVTTDQTVSRAICYQTGQAQGGEVVSPKLKYADALAQVDTVCGALNANSAEINRNCGLHISISWPNMTANQVRRVVARYKEYERQIDAFMPPSRRGNRNRWCGSLDASWVSRLVTQSGDSLSALREGGKFLKLNLMNLDGGPRSRIEFRHHSGTTDARKIQNWIRFLCHMIISANKASGLDPNYKRNKKVVYAEVREQLTAQGFEFAYKRPHWVLTRDGEVVAKLTLAQMDAFYDNPNPSVNRVTNSRFAEFYASIVPDSHVDEGLYNGLDSDTVAYFRARTEQFLA